MSFIVEMIIESQNHFSTLALPFPVISILGAPMWTVDQAFVRAKYKELCIKVHPDKNMHKDAKYAFAKLSAAFQILSNASLAKSYAEDFVSMQIVLLFLKHLESCGKNDAVPLCRSEISKDSSTTERAIADAKKKRDNALKYQKDERIKIAQDLKGQMAIKIQESQEKKFIAEQALKDKNHSKKVHAMENCEDKCESDEDDTLSKLARRPKKSRGNFGI